jgi:hypothetical protein
MVKFGKEKFAIYGGLGALDPNTNARPVHNDVQIFDTKTSTWEYVRPTGNIPRMR